MIVAVSGCDGSGKTTFVKSVVNVTDDKHIKVKTIGEFDYLFLNPIANYMKRKESVRISFLEGEKKIRPLTIVWAHLVYVDCLLRALFLKFSRANVIFDRYFIDHGIGFYNLTGSKYFIKLFRLSPKANLSVYCYTDLNSIYKRRKFQGRKKSFYKNQIESYENYGEYDLKIDTNDRDIVNNAAGEVVQIYEKK